MNLRETHHTALERARQGHVEEGLALLKAAIAGADGGESPRALLPLLRSAAILSRQLGRHADAIRFLEQARAARPEAPYVYLALSDLHSAIGDAASARRYRDLFVEHADPEADADILERVKNR